MTPESGMRPVLPEQAHPQSGERPGVGEGCFYGGPTVSGEGGREETAPHWQMPQERPGDTKAWLQRQPTHIPAAAQRRFYREGVPGGHRLGTARPLDPDLWRQEEAELAGQRATSPVPTAAPAGHVTGWQALGRSPRGAAVIPHVLGRGVRHLLGECAWPLGGQQHTHSSVARGLAREGHGRGDPGARTCPHPDTFCRMGPTW